jgi:anthranilate synthase component 2
MTDTTPTDAGEQAVASDESLAGHSVLVVDNYDSFAYNLVQYLGALLAPGETPQHSGRPPAERASGVVVRRNDDLTLDGIDRLDPDAIVVSPGPGTPGDAGISVPLFAERSYPTLGVCLGHQALCAAHGVPVGHAPSVVHGKPSTVTHDGTGIFAGLPEEFEVGRYHSLAVEHGALPDALTATARTEDENGVVMAVRHATRPHVGVQFHPESILTHEGMNLLENFLREYVTESGGTVG